MVGRQRPLVVSAWGSDAVLLGRGRLGRRLSVVVRAAAAVTVVSRRMRDALVAAGVAANRLHLVASAVERPRLPEDGAAAMRAALGLPAARTLLLFLGRLAVEKGPDVLLEALARLPPAARPFVVIAGDGPLGDALRRDARARGLDGDVLFPGFVPHGGIGAWLRAADALVLPSRSEGLPHAVLEAMAAGLPALASDVGGVGDVVRHEHNGWLVPAADPAALAGAMAAASRDPDRLRRLGAAARDDAERDHVGYERVGRQLAAIYAGVLGRG
jgi:glycosyltransferase involved in cell wall biosynthesis